MKNGAYDLATERAKRERRPNFERRALEKLMEHHAFNNVRARKHAIYVTLRF